MGRSAGPHKTAAPNVSGADVTYLVQVQRLQGRSHRIHTNPEGSRLFQVPSRQQMVQPHQQQTAGQVGFT